MTPAITASNVTYIYPGTRALDDASFTIPSGSVTALVGPNGAGKTTLLRCLAGLDRPLTGAIQVAGIDVLEDPRAAHARMGYLSDFFGIYEALTVRQCLSHAASGHGVPAPALRTTVERTAARLNLEDRLHQRCSELSRGLRQRVAIGQAIVHTPEVLLLDEPAAGLDPEARHTLAGLFTQLCAEGMTLVVSSHILAELDEYSTHMLVLRGGRIVEHRALAAPYAGGQRVRVVLAAEQQDWHAALKEMEGVQVMEHTPREAVLLIAGNAADQARVLRALVEAGIAVAAFAGESENLHDSYLRTVQGAPRP